MKTFLQCVMTNSDIYKNKGTSVWNVFLNSAIRKFPHDDSVVETRYQLSSTKVNARINWTVVGRLTKVTIPATGDC